MNLAQARAPSGTLQRPESASSGSHKRLCPGCESATTSLRAWDSCRLQRERGTTKAGNASLRHFQQYLLIYNARRCLCRLDARRGFQPPLPDLDFTHPELLNFSGHGHRKLIYKPDVLGNLEVRYFRSEEHTSELQSHVN